jgi:signal transduction histidine kinase
MRFPIRLRAASDGSEAAPARVGSDEDARLLRRTRLRLMTWSGGITLAVLLVLGIAIYTAVSNAFTGDSVSRLHGYADFYAQLMSGPQAGPSQNLEPEFGTRYAGLFIICLDSEGRIVFQTGYLPPGFPVQSGLDAAAGGGTDIREVTTGRGVPLRAYSETVAGSNGETYTIQTAADRTEEVNLLGILMVVLVLGGAAALLASLAAGYLYAGRALVPIRDSIGRRQAALQRQREFAANASHELRTPLTVIRASVEDLRRNRRSRVEDVGEALGDIDTEVRHLTALVDDMLLLARTDSGVVEIERVPLDLGDVAVEAACTLTALGEERGVAVEVDPLPAPVVGDPLRLRQLVTILADNAIRHSPAGSTVTVRVRPQGEAALLEVEDRGPGIRPEDMPLLFERFWRADDAPAGGTGLGLAIARWIADQHGGTIGAANRPEGGASFWARLPTAAATAPASGETQAPDEPPSAEAGSTAQGPAA